MMVIVTGVVVVTVPRLPERVPPEKVSVPWVLVSVTKVVLPGRVSVNITFWASLGPLSLTVIV